MIPCHITCLHAQLCTQEQSSALLQFKQQFSFNKSASDEYCNHSYPKMESWKEGSDCCSWDGVECDNNTSQVIGLDLSCSWLHGTINPNSTIFYYFPHLQRLNLASNDLRLEEPGFELLVQNLTKVRELNLHAVNISSVVSNSLLNLTSLTHLDLSWCGLLGKFPDGIFHLPHLNELRISVNEASLVIFPSL
ncbi:hypothetical protein ACSBR1_023648 [Camellia fascicularis]